MDADALPARLERDDAAPTVAAFPDGSVDTFYRVSAGGERVDTREAFADVVSTGSTDVFTLRREAVEPGGHAVNLGEGADRLGNDVVVAGHLDDPAFDDLPFEAVSMGAPATVSVYGFDDGDVLAVENSADLEGWTLADLDAAFGVRADPAMEAFLTSDVVCCVNWTSIPGLPDVLSALAELEVDGGWFVLDPGSVAGRSDAAVARLFDALERLTASYDVVLAANPREVDAMAAGLGRSADRDGEADADAALAHLRERAGLTAAVVHGESRAAAAASDGLVADENFDVDAVRHTGGGDRFDAGLAHALARGWGWADALRLGNACASWYVATGESGTPGELAGFLREEG